MRGIAQQRKRETHAKAQSRQGGIQALDNRSWMPYFAPLRLCVSFLRALVLCTTFLLAMTSSMPAQEKKIAVVQVKYDGLKQEVLKQRGKVVLVDFWATWCVPCKAAFPKVIEWNKKYAEKGLVVISVSVDDLEQPKTVDRVNKFLTSIDAPFRNLLLDEPFDVWAKKLGVKGVPCYFVFDRRGKWSRFEADSIDYESIEKTIAQMVSEK